MNENTSFAVLSCGAFSIEVRSHASQGSSDRGTSGRADQEGHDWSGTGALTDLPPVSVTLQGTG